MSGPIQTIPQGLLGLLQLKQSGQNPSDLSNSVAPFVDLFPLWIQRLDIDLSLQFNGGANDTLTLVTGNTGNRTFNGVGSSVPQGQTWYITRMTLDYSLAAADTIIASPTLLYLGLGTAAVVGDKFQDAITARARRGRTTASGFWAPPGSTFGVYVFDILAGVNTVVTLNLRGVAVPL